MSFIVWFQTVATSATAAQVATVSTSATCCKCIFITSPNHTHTRMHARTKAYVHSRHRLAHHFYSRSRGNPSNGKGNSMSSLVNDVIDIRKTTMTNQRRPTMIPMRCGVNIRMSFPAQLRRSQDSVALVPEDVSLYCASPIDNESNKLEHGYARKED